MQCILDARYARHIRDPELLVGKYFMKYLVASWLHISYFTKHQCLLVPLCFGHSAKDQCDNEAYLWHRCTGDIK